MALEEARLVLGVEPGTAGAEVARRYRTLFKANSAEGCGSVYLQAKVQSAFERVAPEHGVDAAAEWRGFAAGGAAAGDPPPGEQQQQDAGRGG